MRPSQIIQLIDEASEKIRAGIKEVCNDFESQIEDIITDIPNVSTQSEINAQNKTINRIKLNQSYLKPVYDIFNESVNLICAGSLDLFEKDTGGEIITGTSRICSEYKRGYQIDASTVVRKIRGEIRNSLRIDLRVTRKAKDAYKKILESFCDAKKRRAEMILHSLQRELAANQADKNDIKYGQWSGPKDSKNRDICKKLAGKIMHLAEWVLIGSPLDKLATSAYTVKSSGKFNGKWRNSFKNVFTGGKGYNAITDCGGGGCRHLFRPRSEADAFKQRGELKANKKKNDAALVRVLKKVGNLRAA